MASFVTACDTLSAKSVAAVVGPAGAGGGSDGCGRVSRPQPESTMTAAIDSAAILEKVLWPIADHVSRQHRRSGRTCVLSVEIVTVVASVRAAGMATGRFGIGEVQRRRQAPRRRDGFAHNVPVRDRMAV